MAGYPEKETAQTLDGGGSLIGAVRLDADSACGEDIPGLLERYIKNNDGAAWQKIKTQIDHTYKGLGVALEPVLENNGLIDKIKKAIESRLKLFFKPNIVHPEVLGLSGDGAPGRGPTGGLTGGAATTSWTFMAALIRFFHDYPGLCIPYYKMAIGEASSTTPAYSKLTQCTPEALFEGRVELPDGTVKWCGWPFYFVRKYLKEATKPLDGKDEPLNGYEDSIKGNYVTPGDATSSGKLIMYDLNNVLDWRKPEGRGRIVPVPKDKIGGNYNDIVIHKALIGGDPTDPEDLKNYPGSILINCARLKVHCNSIITNAIKNLGIGGWPMCAPATDNPTAHDWLYAYPQTDPPGLKGGAPGEKAGVYHCRWFVQEANKEAMPTKIAEKPNYGLNGTMVDINLAIRAQVHCTLHVVDALRVVNFEHGGSGMGVPKDEGFIFASEDSVALDLLCARYMFKTVPRGGDSGFKQWVRRLKYDGEKMKAIVEIEPFLDDRLSRSKLFGYAKDRQLGTIEYQVCGHDLTHGNKGRLASQNGHLVRRGAAGKYEEVITKGFYYDNPKILWDLQPMVLFYAKATDDLTAAKWHYNPGYEDGFIALDENKDGVIDDDESGKDGLWDCVCGVSGVLLHMMGEQKFEQGAFFQASRSLKYSEKDWNSSGRTPLKIALLSQAVVRAFRMSTEMVQEDWFFEIPYGAGGAGNMWPSMQYARYMEEMDAIWKVLYPNAKACADKKQQTFTLYVPERVPYVSLEVSYNPEKRPNIQETSDPAKIFTAQFGDGEVW